MDKLTAVITGASRGLGRDIALALPEHDIRVVAVARDSAALETLVNAIRAHGGEALACPADVSDVAQVERLQADITHVWGTPTILINAAGIFGPLTLIAKSDSQLWIQTLQTNTIAPYLTCRAFVGGMIENGWGRIINFSSAASLAEPGPLNSAYAVSKTALNQLTRNLAAELEGTGVTANVIHPGEVKTDMWAELRDAAAQTPAAQDYSDWAQWVETTGGDPTHKTVTLILKLLERNNPVNGQFLWIEDGLKHPLPSW